MVRFVDEKQNDSGHCLKKPKRDCAKMIGEKLKKDDDDEFRLKPLREDPPLEVPLTEPNGAEESDPEDDGTYMYIYS